MAIGRPGLKQSHGRLYEEWLDNLSGPRGIKTYVEMSTNDPVIGGFLFAITSILTAVEWHAEPLDAHKPADAKASDFLQTCLRDTADTWSDFIAEALSLVTFGWSLFEIIYKKREGRKMNPLKSSRFDDGLWGWQGFEIRSQESLDRWEFDDAGPAPGHVAAPAAVLPRDLHSAAQVGAVPPQPAQDLARGHQPPARVLPAVGSSRSACRSSRRSASSATSPACR